MTMSTPCAPCCSDAASTQRRPTTQRNFLGDFSDHAHIRALLQSTFMHEALMMCIRKTLYVCIVCGATFAKIQLFAMRVATFAMTGMFAVTASYQFGDIRPAMEWLEKALRDLPNRNTYLVQSWW